MYNEIETTTERNKDNALGKIRIPDLLIARRELYIYITALVTSIPLNYDVGNDHISTSTVLTLSILIYLIYRQKLNVQSFC